MRGLRMRILGLAAALLLPLSGCALLQPPPADDSASSLKREGEALVWQEEYRFVPPPAPWQIIDLDEDDYSVAYMKLCDEAYPCQSTLAYAEEPFGYSLDFQKRQEELFQRFLWASRVNFAEPELHKTEVFGKEGLIALTEGIEPVLGHKVHVKVVFARRGERVVAFYFTQWRAAETAYDLRDQEDFDRFVENFEFLRPSFYERL
ncbi:hypothetical protein SAMN05660860_01146 [Geoalkalibacter ferrihydriticus]|uniref:Lipoprotein n=2 Tax=Geoalkalibacter ferrihydriticus TaxID=392333 RepID=A0A0C2EGE0_9BACT|nr:hypothetical protein [Geoalkalibacter ferrihydriticus]KIH77678.1 hypothetical protein GFER_03160 [Geoalkalibacter ferrihydriticus DSM 17813]SDL73409.1 hypothetical protein SAMN05660860_01146 [Geoalkalibacter ferrihydriticus]